MRHILLALNVLLAIGLVLTTLAGAVAPSRSVLPSVAAYGYLPLLGANVVAAVGWLLARKWPFLISVAAIGVRYSYLGLFVQFGGMGGEVSREMHPESVSVMSYNVHYFSGPELRYAPSDTFALAFLSLVREHRPDVLCLQEYASVPRVRLADSLTEEGYNHRYASGGTVDEPSRSVVFSRLPITYVKRLDGQKVLVEVLHGERALRLCCVYMDPYSFDEADHEEIAQMRHGRVDSTSHRTLRKVKETLVRHEREWKEVLQPVVGECTVPLVVAGDMNDIPGSWLYWRLTERLTDSYREGGFGLGTTYHGSFPRFRIDMVLHNEHLRTLSYRRLRTRLSDHYPILVSLEPVSP